MKISIQTLDEGVRLSVSQPAPYSKSLQSVLSTVDSMFFEEPGDEYWEDTSDETALSQTRLLTGPFALCAAQRYASRMAKDFKRSYDIWCDISRKYEPEQLPCPEVELEFNGQPLADVTALDARVQQEPDMEYDLGQFTLTQPTMRVTDPCYDVGTWCAGSIQALPGRWTAKTVIGPTDWHVRVKVLQVSHESLGDTPVELYESLEKAGLNAGVDSGQCGFFDDALYPRDKKQLEYEDGTFYNDCCQSTLDRANPGGATVRDMGAVSSSGYGDGGYEVYVKRNADGLVVLAQLLFIGDSEEEEDEDEADEVSA